MNTPKHERSANKNVEVAEYNSEIANRLKLICKSTDGGADKLSITAEIPRRTLGNYLSGRNEPKPSACARICTVSGVNISWLITGEGDMRGAEAKENPISRSVGEEKQIANQLDKVEQQLDLQPQPIPQWQQDKVLASIHQQLKNIAALKTIPPRLTARANSILRFSYGDKEAEEIMEERIKAVRSNFREVMHSYKDATKEIDYEPPILITQAIKTVMFTEGLTKEGATILLNALKEQENLEE